MSNTLAACPRVATSSAAFGHPLVTALMIQRFTQKCDLGDRVTKLIAFRS